MRLMPFTISIAVVTLAASLPVHANDLSFGAVPPDQASFNSFAKDVTAAFDYRALGTAAATGVLGLSVGGFASVTQVHDRNAWKTVTGHDKSSITVGGINATKGLFDGFDVGAFVAGVAGTNATLFGAQMRYALLKGTPITPALAVRGTYTGATNIDDFDYRSYGADISISQPLLLLTPYAGVGYVWGKLSPKGNTYLHDSSYDRAKGFVGLRFSLFGVMQATAEYERLGHDNIYSARLGVSL